MREAKEGALAPMGDQADSDQARPGESQRRASRRVGALRARWKLGLSEAKASVKAAELASDCRALMRLGSPYFSSSDSSAREWLKASGGAQARVLEEIDRAGARAVELAFGPGARWIWREPANAWGWEAAGERARAWERFADVFFKRETAASPFALACWAGMGQLARRAFELGGEGAAEPLWRSVGGARISKLCAELGLKRPARARALALAMISGSPSAIQAALELSGPLDERSAELCWALSKEKTPELRARLQELSLEGQLSPPVASAALSSRPRRAL